MILITGGAGFIGSNFILDWFKHSDEPLVNIDALTYAANLENLKSLENDPRYHFVHADINDLTALSQVFRQYRPRAVIHMAAESHVDRSIDGPDVFFTSNVFGTLNLLKAAHAYRQTLSDEEQLTFRLIHVSTDEVYGDLNQSDLPFTEESPYRPNSPYSASKAASDHAVRAWVKTYALPCIITHCSNNFGEFQYPEKLIPRLITRALTEESLPIYGTGENIRDWIDVHEHCRALRLILSEGRIGETYNIGANSERSNLEIVRAVTNLLDELRPRTQGSYADLIEFVQDRAGHDFRYAIDCRKLERELGWKNTVRFESALKRTVLWYLEHDQWIQNVLNKTR